MNKEPMPKEAKGWTSREEIWRDVVEALTPTPKAPPVEPTPTQKAEERWANPPDEAIIQHAAKSAEAQLAMAERWRDRRSEQLAKEYAEWQAEGQDPRVRHQRELDRWWELQRNLAEALDDGYVEVGGFREPRYPKSGFHRAKGDPDYGS